MTAQRGAAGGYLMDSLPTDIADRMILRMLNESVAALSEKVVSDADLLDAGMIFGTGFAPFRGGPIHYAKSQGIKGAETKNGDAMEMNPATTV